MTEVEAASGLSLSGAFSSAVFRDLAASHLLPMTKQKIAQIAELGAADELTLGQSFDRAWNVLSRTYRNEYVFKNQLVSTIVFGRHSPNTASALPELRMGASWADLMVVNGTSTTYEIKTDLDRFGRLATQLPDYTSRSEFVNVVASERRAATAERQVPEHVGVIAIRRNGALRTIRPSQSNMPLITSAALFTMLRTGEAIEILRTVTGYKLDVPAGLAWKRARDLFAELPVAETHTAVVRILRGRGRTSAELALGEDFPPSLRALAYTAELSLVGRQRIRERLARPATLVLGR